MLQGEAEDGRDAIRSVRKFKPDLVLMVEKHRAKLMKKLSLHNASALTVFVIKKGLITE